MIACGLKASLPRKEVLRNEEINNVLVYANYWGVVNCIFTHICTYHASQSSTSAFTISNVGNSVRRQLGKILEPFHHRLSDVATN
jgi:hypothetical protein